MKTLIFTGVLLIVAGVYFVAFKPELTGGPKKGNQQKVEGDVDRDQAIKIAQQHAAKTNIDPSRYEASVCLVSSLWRVYLEPKPGQDLNEVLEYAITEKGGLVLTAIKLSGSPNKNAGGSLTREDAIAIAKKDAMRAPDFSNKQLTVCELRNFWRIIYSAPSHLEGGGREYLIDKTNGAITDKKYYQ